MTCIPGHPNPPNILVDLVMELRRVGPNPRPHVPRLGLENQHLRHVDLARRVLAVLQSILKIPQVSYVPKAMIA